MNRLGEKHTNIQQRKFHTNICGLMCNVHTYDFELKNTNLLFKSALWFCGIIPASVAGGQIKHREANSQPFSQWIKVKNNATMSTMGAVKEITLHNKFKELE